MHLGVQDTSSPCLIVGLANVYISMYSSINGQCHVHVFLHIHHVAAGYITCVARCSFIVEHLSKYEKKNRDN